MVTVRLGAFESSLTHASASISSSHYCLSVKGTSEQESCSRREEGQPVNTGKLMRHIYTERDISREINTVLYYINTKFNTVSLIIY